jgi:hypothetical protein
MPEVHSFRSYIPFRVPNMLRSSKFGTPTRSLLIQSRYGSRQAVDGYAVASICREVARRKPSARSCLTTHTSATEIVVAAPPRSPREDGRAQQACRWAVQPLRLRAADGDTYASPPGPRAATFRSITTLNALVPALTTRCDGRYIVHPCDYLNTPGDCSACFLLAAADERNPDETNWSCGTNGGRSSNVLGAVGRVWG